MSATALPAVERAPRLSPMQRLEVLCDPGTVRVLRSRVSQSRLGERAVDGDGVVGATGLINGRPIACYAQDASLLGGALGQLHAETIVRVLQTAERARIPVVGFVESGGARIQEGTAALAGYGKIFRETVRLTGVVPQISIVSGASAGGGAYSPALTDVIVMTEDAAMFLTGPGVVREALGEEIDAAGLGGPRVHDRNGVCHLVETDETAAALRVRDLLGYLPSVAGGPVPRSAGRRPRHPDPGAFVPAEPRRVYDVREALDAIVDRDSMLELHPRWARNIVTMLARIDGHPVAIVANQPRYLGGVLDASSSEKAARFIGFCDSFSIPLVAIVDTPGFMPGSKQEQAGVIRHGASLVRAFAAARVPKFTVVLRKSYGGAYITMNSRDLGADLVMAWPDAELGIMSARAAVGIVQPARAGRRAGPRLRARSPRRRLRRGASARRQRGRRGFHRRDHRARSDARPPRVGRCARSAPTARRRRSGRSCLSCDDGDPAGQASADHRRHHQGLDRLPRRRARPARGRRGAAHVFWTGQAHDRAGGRQVARTRRCARARRELRRRPRRAHGGVARTLGPRRRSPARDRVRPPGRARGEVHDRPRRRVPRMRSRPRRSPTSRWRRHCCR